MIAPLSGRPAVEISPPPSTPDINIARDVLPSICPANNTVNPACILALYNIPTTWATEPSNTLAVSGFNNEFANVGDLKVSICL